MQTKPTSWNSIFAASHITEYRFDIDGVSYYRADLKEAPVIKKPLLDKPAIGRCCTGSVQLKIFPKGDISKAATVNAYCRLKNRETGQTTDWLPQGKFLIARRRGKKTLTLQCSDYMIKAGQTYRDKSALTSWPQSMPTVVNEICRIMGVTLDSRTSIKSGIGYTVDYPNDDTLMSEVLRNIAAAHGGNWIMTESGKLRLVPFASPAGTASQILGHSHGGFEEIGRARTVSRVILTDSAKNEFTAGDDTDLTITASCEYATQAIALALCASETAAVEKGCISVPTATFSKGLYNVQSGSTTQGRLNIQYNGSLLYGVNYQAYTLSTAYLDPALELGDTISVTARDGTEYKVVIFSLDMNCTTSATCSLSASIDDETEDEFPYITLHDLSLSRTLKSDQTYYGNRINRSEGFVSELLINGEAQARLTANASTFSMQAKENGAWKDRIFFDAVAGKYVITGEVEVQGLATFESSLEDFENGLAVSGTTTINGGNITTGIIQSHNGNLKFNLDTGVLSVSNKSLSDILSDQEASISTNADNIALCVRSGDIISTINQSAEGVTISASKIDLTGYVTINSLKNGTTTINGGCITTGTIDATKVRVINLDAGNITSGSISADFIKGGTIDAQDVRIENLDASSVTITNLSASAITGGTLDCSKITVSKLNAGSITSGTLDCSKITVSNLDASSITAGTIKASLIDVDNLKVKNLYYDNNNTMVSGTGNTVYLGGNGTWGVNYANVYAGTEVGIGGPNSWSSRVIFDVSRSTIQPKSTNGWSLGTSTYPFENFYCKKVSLGSSSYNSQISFFGHALQSQQTLSNSATLAQVITALKNYGLFK